MEEKKLAIMLFSDGSEKSGEAQRILEKNEVPYLRLDVPEPENRPLPPGDLDKVEAPYLLEPALLAPRVGVEQIKSYAEGLAYQVEHAGIRLRNPLLE